MTLQLLQLLVSQSLYMPLLRAVCVDFPCGTLSAAAFKHSTSLRLLDVSGNNIGTTGARELAAALAGSPHCLTDVHVGGNLFRRLGLAPLLQALLACPLQSLSVSLACVRSYRGLLPTHATSCRFHPRSAALCIARGLHEGAPYRWCVRCVPPPPAFVSQCACGVDVCVADVCVCLQGRAPSRLPHGAPGWRPGPVAFRLRIGAVVLWIGLLISVSLCVTGPQPVRPRDVL